MKSTEVLILGGGPAGLSLSIYLADRGIESQVLEKSGAAGGLARSFKVGPYTFDHSGHLLHTNKKEVLDLIEKRLKVSLNRIDRRSVCWVEDRFIPFPYQQNLFYLDPESIRQALVGFFERTQKNPRNFREWIHASYGEGVGRRFLYPYNTKLWNTDLRRMAVDWIPRFLPSSDPKQILKSAFYREKDPWGYNAVFFYPTFGGIGTIGNRLAAAVSGRTTLNARIARIDLRRKTVSVAEGDTWRYGKLVSTIPLPEFLKLAGMPVSPLIQSTGVSVFNVGLREPFPHDFHWCYVPQKSIPFYRYGVYSNISRRAAPDGHSALYIECAAPPRRLDRFRFEDIRSHLLKMKLLRSAGHVDTVQRLDLRYAYPLPLIGLSRLRDRMQEKLRGRDVELLGRFGAWRYVAISDVIVEAKELSARLARRR